MLDLDMSPYAAFVWSAWGITAAVLTGLVARAFTASRRWKAELRRLEAEAQMGTGRPERAHDAADSQPVPGAAGPQP